MSLREAAQMALEAIEYGSHGDPHIAGGKRKRAVEALRAALADPYDEIAAGYRKDVEALSEAPKAEPVESALEARIDTLTTTLGALAGSAEVHIWSFDADDMPSDVERLLEETKVARAVLAAARGKG